MNWSTAHALLPFNRGLMVENRCPPLMAEAPAHEAHSICSLQWVLKLTACQNNKKWNFKINYIQFKMHFVRRQFYRQCTALPFIPSEHVLKLLINDGICDL